MLCAPGPGGEGGWEKAVTSLEPGSDLPDGIGGSTVEVGAGGGYSLLRGQRHCWW